MEPKTTFTSPATPVKVSLPDVSWKVAMLDAPDLIARRVDRAALRACIATVFGRGLQGVVHPHRFRRHAFADVPTIRRPSYRKNRQVAAADMRHAKVTNC